MLLTVAAVALLLSCGGGKKPPAQLPASSFQLSAQHPDSSQLTAESSTTLDETLAELDALETPEGVDASLFSELKDEPYLTL